MPSPYEENAGDITKPQEQPKPKDDQPGPRLVPQGTPPKPAL